MDEKRMEYDIMKWEKCYMYLLHETAEIKSPFVILILPPVPKANSISFWAEL